MMDTPCESCFPCLCGVACPCLSAMILRREALRTAHPDTGFEHYQCFQGLNYCCCLQCCVECSRAPCLRVPCWILESCLCPGLSLSSTRVFLQHKYNIQSDPCDNRLIRFNNCMQCISCICSCAACITRIDAMEQAACIFDLVTCVVFSCTMGCMAAQINDECEFRQSEGALKNVAVEDVTGTA